MNKPLAFLLLLLLGTPAVAGDLFGIGLRAGAPLTDAFEAVNSPDFNFRSSTKRFTIGPSAELFLPFGFGVEADVLYRRTEMEVTSTGSPEFPTEPVTTSQSVGVWEIPMMGKWRFPGGGLRPFIGAGGSFRSFGDLPAFSTNLNDSGWGFVLGAGLEIKIKRVRISPEIRYTRWGSGQKDTGDSLLRYNQNQADFLVGVTF
jgi:hypothetical protein